MSLYYKTLIFKTQNIFRMIFQLKPNWPMIYHLLVNNATTNLQLNGPELALTKYFQALDHLFQKRLFLFIQKFVNLFLDQLQ